MEFKQENIGMIFLIQGVFFQRQQWMEIGICPVIGYAPLVRHGMCSHNYSGQIWTDPQSPFGELRGYMEDHFGKSVLSDIRISEDRVRFTKKYEDRDDCIHYTFEVRDHRTWMGHYRGDACGEGVSCCVLTEVEERFFWYQSVVERLSHLT